MRNRWTFAFAAATVVLTLAFLSVSTRGQGVPGGREQAPEVQGPWMDKSLSADRRAELLVEQMTLDEKLGLVHGGAPYSIDLNTGAIQTVAPAQSLGGAGWVPGIPRLGLPDLQMTDGRTGGSASSGRITFARTCSSRESECRWTTASKRVFCPARFRLSTPARSRKRS